MAIKGLTFTAMPTTIVDAKQDRRNRIIAKLEEQKLLLKDANYKRTIKERVKNAQGVKELVEKKQTVKKWWIVSSNGSVAFFVRSGKLVEFEKGKTAIIAQSLDKLPATIDLLIAAVKSGELDAQLEQAGKAVGQRKREAA